MPLPDEHTFSSMNGFKGEGPSVVAIMNVSCGLMHINAKRGKHADPVIAYEENVLYAAARSFQSLPCIS